ncbi:nuclear transport factor 2 family protein [Marinibaculum pumilum]|uniref:Nuclear transport factor 2 family protein n=1 Tax=Marinibaculum pumilum TaxID=1766165 RepID=A0ABV7L5Y4_9PROT
MADDLEARVARLAAIEEITRLKHLYWHYNDQGLDAARIGPLFVDEGVWSNAELGHHEGRAAIEDFFGGASATITFCAHLGMNGIVEVDGDTARGRWRLLLPCTFMQDGRKVSRWILGDYDDAFVRRDGSWLFSRLDVIFNFNVAQGDSWAGMEQVRAG